MYKESARRSLPYAVRRHRVLARARPAGPWDPMVTDAHDFICRCRPRAEGFLINFSPMYTEAVCLDTDAICLEKAGALARSR